MDDNTLDIIEKIYSEILNIKQDISDIKQVQDKIQYDIMGVKQDFMKLKLETTEIKQEIIGTKHAIRRVGSELEVEIVPKIEAQFDEYKQNTEQIVALEDIINNMDSELVQLKLDIESSSSDPVQE